MSKFLLCTLLIILFSGHALAETTPGTPPTIMQHPKSMSTFQGTIAEFSVTATGPAPLTYQWQKLTSLDYFSNVQQWSDISGANDATYSFVVQRYDIGFRLRVVVSNNYGSVISNVATFGRLNPSPPGPGPAPILIYTQPAANTIITEGSITGNLYIEAREMGQPGDIIRYQWFSNTINSNQGGAAIPGATSASFSIPTTLTASGSPYFYYCVLWLWWDHTIHPFRAPQPPVTSQVAAVVVNAPGTTFIPVTNITDVPTMVTAGVPLNLSGTVMPLDATNRTIAWSALSAGKTGATITGDILNTTAAGTVVVTANIADGLSVGFPYTQNFIITVNAQNVHGDGDGSGGGIASGSESDNASRSENASGGCNSIMFGGMLGMLVLFSALWVRSLWSVKKKNQGGR